MSAVDPIRQLRVAAYFGSSSGCCGTLTYAVSPMLALRSANDSLDASRYWNSAFARASFDRLNDDRMLRASPIVIPPEDDGGMP